eukprot:Gregarina_sp_Poly_1__8699@NODE_519_length_7749_cov_140_117548_g412_i0_p4_GENE_NODE_519_length_7749_cov_140_117548_g412_i0NODE_519_length_7749_cov_140_117548_g412_i0_p4_ORF_typecomplete_len214_score35_40_NODE_519_length_7749_cov_140_117548_g412_i045695210
MSVLNPVVSLLDGLNLSDRSDQAVVADIKSKLARIGGVPTSDESMPPRPKPSTEARGDSASSRVLRGAKTSAFCLLPPTTGGDAEHLQQESVSPDLPCRACGDDSACSELCEDEDEVASSQTMCGSVFDSLYERFSSLWMKPASPPALSASPPKRQLRINADRPVIVSHSITPPQQPLFTADGRPMQALLNDMSPQILSTRSAKVVQRIPFDL